MGCRTPRNGWDIRNKFSSLAKSGFQRRDRRKRLRSKWWTSTWGCGSAPTCPRTANPPLNMKIRHTSLLILLQIRLPRTRWSLSARQPEKIHPIKLQQDTSAYRCPPPVFWNSPHQPSPRKSRARIMSKWRPFTKSRLLKKICWSLNLSTRRSTSSTIVPNCWRRPLISSSADLYSATEQIAKSFPTTCTIPPPSAIRCRSSNLACCPTTM